MSLELSLEMSPLIQQVEFGKINFSAMELGLQPNVTEAIDFVS